MGWRWGSVCSPSPEQTDTCENITCRRTTYAGGKKQSQQGTIIVEKEENSRYWQDLELDRRNSIFDISIDRIKNQKIDLFGVIRSDDLVITGIHIFQE